MNLLMRNAVSESIRTIRYFPPLGCQSSCLRTIIRWLECAR